MRVLSVQIDQAGYDKDHLILSDIAFSVNQGDLVGLIGPNGAGKSTTIKAILGVLNEFKGKIQIDSKQNKYAYIPEQPVLYDELTLWEHLELVAAVNDMDMNSFPRKANQLLKRFDLLAKRDDLPGSFSKGMKQKIMIIINMMIDCDLYIVDEPFVGLDPLATKEFLDLIEERREQGAGILLSTHVLDTAEKICNRFVMLHNGRLVAKGSLNEIRASCDLPKGSLFDCFYSILKRNGGAR